MNAYRPGTEAHKTALVNAVYEYVACQIPEVVEHDATARASLQASAREWGVNRGHLAANDP